MTDVIFITGCKGGVGTTTVAIGLGAALARLGERTLVLDGDDNCASGLEISNLQGLGVYTLADAQKGACRVKQAILSHPDHPNLFVLPTLDCHDEQYIAESVKDCAPLFDRVICDGRAAQACNRALLVSDPYPNTLSCARKKAAALTDGGFKDTKLILNKVNGGLVFDGFILTPQEIATLTRIPLCAVIPEDLKMPIGKTRPETQKAFGLAAEFLMGKNDKFYRVIKPYSGVKGIIKRKMRDKI